MEQTVVAMGQETRELLATRVSPGVIKRFSDEHGFGFIWLDECGPITEGKDLLGRDIFFHVNDNSDIVAGKEVPMFSFKRWSLEDPRIGERVVVGLTYDFKRGSWKAGAWAWEDEYDRVRREINERKAKEEDDRVAEAARHLEAHLCGRQLPPETRPKVVEDRLEGVVSEEPEEVEEDGDHIHYGDGIVVMASRHRNGNGRHSDEGELAASGRRHAEDDERSRGRRCSHRLPKRVLREPIEA